MAELWLRQEVKEVRKKAGKEGGRWWWTARDKYIAGTGDQDFDSAKTNLCV